VPKPVQDTFKIIFNILYRNYDIIQTNTRFFVTSFIGLCISKFMKKPLVHIEYGSRHSVMQNLFVDIISRTYDHTLGAFLIKNADMLFCNCHATEEFLRHLGANCEISLIPLYGINRMIFRKSPTKLKTQLNINGSLVLTSISRLIYAKGVQDIILAFPQITKDIFNTKLIIVGDGPYRQELEKLADKVDRENIIFLGQLSPEKVAEVLNISDIFINASYSEALTACPVIEAGAIGVPSVTTDAGGTREVISDYENGLLIAPGNIDELAKKSCELLKNKDLRAKLGANIQSLVNDRFDWDNNIDIFIGELQSVVIRTDV
jgi:glycosyltransferase involved in cell wall biosynthesis